MHTQCHTCAHMHTPTQSHTPTRTHIHTHRHIPLHTLTLTTPVQTCTLMYLYFYTFRNCRTPRSICSPIKTTSSPAHRHVYGQRPSQSPPLGCSRSYSHTLPHKHPKSSIWTKDVSESVSAIRSTSTESGLLGISLTPCSRSVHKHTSSPSLPPPKRSGSRERKAVSALLPFLLFLATLKQEVYKIQPITSSETMHRYAD